MNESRIVITGIGALSPNGIGRESYFMALVDGILGLGIIFGVMPALS